MSRPLRRSQAISPFGIGALVDFPGPVSLIHAGLDAWPYDESRAEHREFQILDERRLATQLGVDYFVQPPDYRRPALGNPANQINLDLKLPFLRFPLWHVCPRCGRMHRSEYQRNAAPRCVGPIGTGAERGAQHRSRNTVQVRFVVACRNGHLQDFPWLEWLFKSANPDWRPEGDSRWLRLRTTGSASLGGVEIAAEERDGNAIRVVIKRTLAGAFEGDASANHPSALSNLGIMCSGHNPALGIGDGALRPRGCGQHLYLLLRGATNLYFPHVFSSIYIPDIDNRGLPPDVLELLDDHEVKISLLDAAKGSDEGLVSKRAAKIALDRWRRDSTVAPETLAEAANQHLLKDIVLGDRTAVEFLRQRQKVAPDRRLTADMIRLAIEARFPDWAVDPAVLVESVSRYLSSDGGAGTAGTTPLQDPQVQTEYRRAEYRIFCRDVHDGYPKANLLIRSGDIGEYGSLVRDSFDHVALLHKLRETRAFVGFSRIFSSDELSEQERWALFSTSRKRWLPAIVVRGEGIFLRFRDERIRRWLERWGPVHTGRLEAPNRSIEAARARRHEAPMVVTPKFVLLHTCAHLLINQLVFDCGYGSASLRERIYSTEGEDPMSGILIYTAAGDSEGTMGGLVKMGRAGYLEDVVTRALVRAKWCSTDPVCIESRGQGPDSCNLGACHSCALLPETSCEQQNRLLDRGVLIGLPDYPDSGFFSGMV